MANSITWEIFFQAAYLVTHENLDPIFNFTPYTRYTFVKANLPIIRCRFMTMCGTRDIPPVVCEAFRDYLVALGDSIFTVPEFQDVRNRLMYIMTFPPPPQ